MPTGTAATPASDDEGFDLHDYLADEWPGDDEDAPDAAAADSPALSTDDPAPEGAQADAVDEGAGEGDAVQPEAEAAPPESEAPPEGEPTPEPKVEAKQEAPQFQSLPLSFKADGREVTVQGAETRVFQDGSRLHLLTDDAWRRIVQPRLRDPETVQKYRLESERQIAELRAATDPQHNPVVQSAAKAMAFIETLLGEDLTDVEAATRVLDKLHEWKQGYPVWKAQQERDTERARADAILGARDSVQPEPDAYAVEQAQAENEQRLGTGLHGFLSSLLQDPKFQGLTQASVTAVMEDAWEQRHRFVFQADQDYPEMGLKKGELFFDFRGVEKSLSRAHARDVKFASVLAAERARVQAKIPEVAAVARENAAALRKPPAATGARPTGARPAATTKPNGEIPTWDEFKDSFMAEDLLAD